MTETVTPLRAVPTDFAPSSPESDDAATLTELFLAFRRQRFVLLIAALLGLAAGAFHYATSPKEYYAAATVLVSERQSDPSGALEASLPLLRGETAVLNEMQVLKSGRLGEDVVRALNLHENDAFLFPAQSVLGQTKDRLIAGAKSLIATPEPVVDTGSEDSAAAEDQKIAGVAAVLAGRLRAERVGRSNAISISYISHDPALATAIVNTYAEAYLEDQLNANLENSNRTADWMRPRLDELREAATEAAREAEDFRAENRALDQQGLRERNQRAETLNELYQTILTRYNEVTIEGSFPISNGRILSLANEPTRAALPKSWQLLAVGLVLGLMAGLGFAVLRELRETGFRTGEDVRTSLALPFLGYLPTFSERQLARKRPSEARNVSDRAEVGFASTRTADGTEAHPLTLGKSAMVQEGAIQKARRTHYHRTLFVPALAPHAAFSQTLTGILASLDQERSDRQGRVVACGSVLPGEGSTTLTGNLALLAARTGHRTLMIDLDLEKPDLSTRLKCHREPGVLEVLDGTTGFLNAMRRLPYSGLDFLPCKVSRGKSRGSDPSYLSDMADLIRTMRTRYNYIFLDLPAMGARSDGKALLANIDRLVMTARWGTTARTTLQDYLDNAPEIRRKTLGVALNRVEPRRLAQYGVRPASHGLLHRAARI